MTTGDPVPGRASRPLRVQAFDGARLAGRADEAVVEEPLEIRVIVAEDGLPRASTIAVTMRTPGHDIELATGFLLAEGVVDDASRIARVEHAVAAAPEARGNIVLAELVAGASFDAARFARNVLMTSSCGICGRTSIEAVNRAIRTPLAPGPVVDARTLVGLPARLAERQGTFARTGGLHAAASIRADGTIDLVREDVGRHNALDKLVGALAASGRLPASETIALVSGRAGFELVQKALVAGFPVLAAIGAPSSLAVALAARHGMTLIGFLREGRFNIYCCATRVRAPGTAG